MERGRFTSRQLDARSVTRRDSALTLQDLGNLGELISAVAVVVSLAYLDAQIRQNTKSVRTSTYQAILDSSRSDTELILANPHLERIYHVGVATLPRSPMSSGPCSECSLVS